MGTVATPLWSRTISCATLRARHMDGAPWVLELSGEADIATMGRLRRELALLTTIRHANAEVELAALTFAYVASAHLLLTARRRVPVTLTGATASVRRLFDLLEVLKTSPLRVTVADRSGRIGERRVSTGFEVHFAGHVAGV